MKYYSLEFKSNLLNRKQKMSLGLFNLLKKDEKEISQKYKKVYQKGKGSDSPGSFGFERTRAINKTTL